MRRLLRSGKRRGVDARKISAPPVILLILFLSWVARAETVSGSGFVVGSRGEVLTTAHIVAGCSKVDIQLSSKRAETAIVVARDPQEDLAIVRLDAGAPAAAIFRAGGGPRAGDTVIADIGDAGRRRSATDADVSVGSVSDLAGPRNDARYLQISGPLQPGKGGGPLLDTSGHVIGIVAARADALRIAGTAGDLPRNVNFALKAEIATAFLDINGVDYRAAPSDAHFSPIDVGASARAFTVHIECRQTKLEGDAAAETAPSILPGGTPFEQYNYALGLLHDGNNDAAEQALRAFIERYPADALSGNAQYRLGEALYARQDYSGAADAFAGGYQKYPSGGKAPDNLLMLGMALSQLGQKADACRAFAKLNRDFPGASSAIKERARDEKKRLRC
jgi:tol-pal system protein YbgF